LPAEWIEMAGGLRVLVTLVIRPLLYTPFFSLLDFISLTALSTADLEFTYTA
jgi:hypothetical protein